MVVKFKTSSFRLTRWYEYAIRFALGGLGTVLAGVVAHEWGPEPGGFFLAFPAIFAAAATLIEQHEMRKGRCHGASARVRACRQVALDASGAALGCAGMLLFAIFIWLRVQTLGIAAALILGMLIWASANLSSWSLWRGVKRKLRRRAVNRLRAERTK